MIVRAIFGELPLLARSGPAEIVRRRPLSGYELIESGAARSRVMTGEKRTSGERSGPGVNHLVGLVFWEVTLSYFFAGILHFHLSGRHYV